MALRHGMKFIILHSFDNYVEAHIVMGNLQHQNINCWLKDEYSVTIDPILSNAIGGIKLMVAEAQASRAAEIMQQLKAKSHQQYGCPYCGSTNIEYTRVAHKPRNLLDAIAHWLKGSHLNEIWHCKHCSETFEQPSSVRQAVQLGVDKTN